MSRYLFSRIDGLVRSVIASAGIVGLVFLPALVAEGTPGYYYPGYTEYTFWGCAGTSGEILVTNPTPAAGSGDAHCMLSGFANFDFFAIGWVEGATPWGSTGSVQKLYWDAVCWGVYQGGLIATATTNTWHTFKIDYLMGSLNTWSVYVDGVSKKTLQFTDRVGVPVSQFETHDNTDVISGHVRNLQYGLCASRFFRWYAWNGYGVVDSDPPYDITIISNTEWTCSGP